MSLFVRLSMTSTSVTRARLLVCLKHRGHSQVEASNAKWNQHIQGQMQSGELMFSLRGTESGKLSWLRLGASTHGDRSGCSGRRGDGLQRNSQMRS